MLVPSPQTKFELTDWQSAIEGNTKTLTAVRKVVLLTLLCSWLQACHSKKVPIKPGSIPENKPVVINSLLPSDHPFSESNCEKFRSEISTEYKSGYVTVPEDYANPNGPKINVLWFMRKAAVQTPVAFFYGGPIYDDRMHFKSFSSIEEKFGLNIIYIDQRGTGCSGRPLAPIQDPESARKASLYSSDYIVRDAEAVRKTVLGEHTKWKIFGQSWGGYIVDRYVTTFPKSIISAHVFAGGAEESALDFFIERIKSNHRVAWYLLSENPGSFEKLMNLKSMFKHHHCFVFFGRSICGEDLYHEIAEEYLNNLSNWSPLLTLLDQPTGEAAPFAANGELNMNFWNAFAENNAWFFKFFFDYDQQLKVLALKIQETNFNAENQAVLCKSALKQLEIEGYNLSELPYNHCARIIKIGEDPEFDNRWKFVKNTPQRKALQPKDLFFALRENPQIKYYSHVGKFDGIDVWQKHFKLFSNLPNFVGKVHEDADHGGYMVETEFWQDLSGKKASLLDARVNVTFDEIKIEYMAKAGANYETVKGRSVTSSAVFIGYAEKEIEQELAAKLKGKIALITRGKASFVDKVKNAVNAGATAVIIGNNNKYVNRPFAVPVDLDLQIPVVMMETKEFAKIVSDRELGSEILNLQLDVIK